MAGFGLTRKAGYAVIVLSRLAEQGEAATGRPPLSARRLAELEALPLPVLSSLLKQLQRAGLVTSCRGARGGYYLADKPERVRVSHVVRAVETGEPVQLARCCGPDGKRDGSDACRAACNCPIRHAMQHLDHRLSRFLDQMTLADLLNGEASNSVHPVSNCQTENAARDSQNDADRDGPRQGSPEHKQTDLPENLAI